MVSILITGGAGYIGSQIVRDLREAGQPVVVLDNLSTGTPRLLPAETSFVLGDIRDQAAVRKLLSDFSVSEVIHCAGSISVEESVSRPWAYFANNAAGTMSLLEQCAEAGVRRFVFSSTAAVYGAPNTSTVDESHNTRPESPYGMSKLLAEQAIRESAPRAGIAYVILRYFNVAGADPGGRGGQTNPQATHLIMNAIRAAKGEVPCFRIYGGDYATADGTGVRDFIHVKDLSAVHLLALDYLRRGSSSAILNCGYGKGFSVREVVDMVKQVTGAAFPVEVAARRPGDIAAIQADSRAARALLGWSPKWDDLRTIVQHAWNWERQKDSNGDGARQDR